MDYLKSKNAKKSILFGAIGNILEWYDFTIYGYFSTLLAGQFFPKLDPAASLLSTFGIFAIGFLVRPIGGIFFGHISDRLGRKRSLTLSILLMAIPTALIGLLPTYSLWGVFAPLLLTFLRLLQGFSLGGEYPTTMLFLTEHAPPEKKGFYGSFVLVGAGFGWLLGSFVSGCVAYFLSEPEMAAWGWRIPFLIGGVTGFFGSVIRSYSDETPVFEHLKDIKEIHPNPLQDVIQSQKRRILTIIGYNLLPTVAGYMIFAYMPTFLHIETKISLSTALLLNALMLVLFNGLAPLAGYLSDRMDRLQLLFFGAIGFIVFSYPLFLLLTAGELPFLIVGLVGLSMLIALYHGPLPAFMVEYFPIETRASSLSLAYNFAASVFCGTCPLVCTFLIQVTGSNLAPAGYLILVSIGSLVTILIDKPKTVKVPA